MRTLTLTAAAVAASAFLAFTAQAATLTMVADKSTYAVSETITLTITGDSQGAAALGIFGTVNYDQSLTTVTSQAQSQLTSFGFLMWINGALALDAPNAGTADAFVAINGTTGPLTVDQLLTSTIELTADAAGVANFSWFNTGSEFLNFFGINISSALGTSVTIVPEPTTAALLGMGLLGLAVAGRRR